MYTHGEVANVHPNGRICYKVPPHLCLIVWEQRECMQC